MNKGFTLVELIAVIILLGVLSLIATLTINSTLKEKKEDSCRMQIENIISGAERWAGKNVFLLPGEEGDSIIKTLGDLKSAGFVDKDIKNPITNQQFSDDIRIKITRIDNNYKYEVEGVSC